VIKQHSVPRLHGVQPHGVSLVADILDLVDASRSVVNSPAITLKCAACAEF
jgi:hypothetical protein